MDRVALKYTQNNDLSIAALYKSVSELFNKLWNLKFFLPVGLSVEEAAMGVLDTILMHPHTLNTCPMRITYYNVYRQIKTAGLIAERNE